MFCAHILPVHAHVHAIWGGVFLFLKDYGEMRDYFKTTCRKDMKEVDLCVKGWNWGEATINGSLLSFMVDSKRAFEVPLKEVSQVCEVCVCRSYWFCDVDIHVGLNDTQYACTRLHAHTKVTVLVNCVCGVGWVWSKMGDKERGERLLSASHTHTTTQVSVQAWPSHSLHFIVTVS